MYKLKYRYDNVSNERTYLSQIEANLFFFVFDPVDP